MNGKQMESYLSEKKRAGGAITREEIPALIVYHRSVKAQTTYNMYMFSWHF